MLWCALRLLFQLKLRWCFAELAMDWSRSAWIRSEDRANYFDRHFVDMGEKNRQRSSEMDKVENLTVVEMMDWIETDLMLVVEAWKTVEDTVHPWASSTPADVLQTLQSSPVSSPADHSRSEANHANTASRSFHCDPHTCWLWCACRRSASRSKSVHCRDAYPWAKCRSGCDKCFLQSETMIHRYQKKRHTNLILLLYTTGMVPFKLSSSFFEPSLNT